ncbi:MAG: ribosome biogenesis GTPase Der [Parcubacteria group bacterium CG23_combo_of_CG06-09_8_20_14_all_35_9]|nr:MAG: ribosome biogenesis GTPase Der [Parcubacteria group bacterium CG23_combo_of_CG06-09_8_20_14_all_35_9]
MSNHLPIIAIIGRTNVGKSTLFNCLIEKRKAITSKIPGTTRDRNYGQCLWQNQKFILIDTGGAVEVRSKKLEVRNKEKKQRFAFEEEIQNQIRIALKEADLILLVVDIRMGILSQDKELALFLKKRGKPTILACNKADSPSLGKLKDEFFKLGLGPPLPISATTGSGVGDLLDEIVKKLPTNSNLQPITHNLQPVKIAIIGKPNVGKSSLLNAILGEERVIISETPHTTREPQDILINYKEEQPILLVDTAGIRKQSKIKEELERLGVEKSIEALKRTDIALLVIESQKPLTTQDSHLAGLILKAKTGITIVANKWDLIEEKTQKTQAKFIYYLQEHFPYLRWAPIIFVSAKTGQRVNKILDLALKIEKERKKTISQENLEKFMDKIKKTHPARVGKKKKKYPKIYGLTQTGTAPPRFELMVSKKENLHSSYLRFIENRLRDEFSFIGTPISIETKELKNKKVFV